VDQVLPQRHTSLVAPTIFLTRLLEPYGRNLLNEDLKARIQADLITVRKQRDKLRTLVLSTVLSEVKNKEIALREELDGPGVQQVVAKAIKQRRDAASQMRDGGRADLAEKEEAEVEILKPYLPPEIDDDTVRAWVQEIVAGGVSQMGAVMGQLMPKIRGRFDGTKANQIVKEELESAAGS